MGALLTRRSTLRVAGAPHPQGELSLEAEMKFIRMMPLFAIKDECSACEAIGK
jgi:hypothetical protein